MSNQPLSVLPASAGSEEPVGACCTLAGGAALSAEQAARLAPMFKALGDPARLRLLSLIAASGSEACVCDLTEAFDLTGPTISHHLRVLREAGLVDCERRGTWVYYWIRPQVLRGLAGLLRGVPLPAK
jgi:ArsR family transcriptional regulator, arsenate/arsenite/antimonite-responsive transcriptional repressor